MTHIGTTQVHRSRGYWGARTHEAVELGYRPVVPLVIAGAVLGLVELVAWLNFALALAGVSVPAGSDAQRIAVVALGAVAGVAGAGVVGVLLRWRAMKALPEASSGRWRFDRSAGVLLDASGARVAPLDALEVREGLDVPEGLGRISRTISLRWPGGSARVFRGPDRAQHDAVVAMLRAEVAAARGAGA